MEQFSSSNDSNLIPICLPKLSPAYYILSIIIFLVAPTILTIIVGCTKYLPCSKFSCKDLLFLIFVRLPLYFVCIYIFLPILAIFHNIQVILPCKLPKLSITLPFDNWKLDKYSLDIFKFLEQIGEALPQFILCWTFYSNNYHYINTYDTLFGTHLPITLVSVIFSGVSVLFGIFSGFAAFNACTRNASADPDNMY